MTEASSQFRNRLRTYLHGVDLDQLGIVQLDWGYIHDPMTQTATYLADNVEVARGVGGRDLSTELAGNFARTAAHLRDRAARIRAAASSLEAVNTALANALKDQQSWDASPLTAPTPPDRTDPKYDATGPDGRPTSDVNADQASYNAQNSTYQTQSGDREQQAQQHLRSIDAAMTTAITAMKDIHQQPDSSSTPSSGAGSPTGGGLSIPTGIGTPLSTGARGHSTTSITGGDQPGPVGAPLHAHPPAGAGGHGDPGTPWRGDGAAGTGPAGTGPGGIGPGGNGGGPTWKGADPLAGGPSTGGFPSGVGLGAAVLGGGLVAGAGGVAGLRALGGALLPEEAALGVSARGTGGPGVLGTGAAQMDEGAPGGRAGVGGAGAGGMGGRAAGGAAGGRGRGQGRRRAEGEHGDLWDDGEDWIDDEGAAPGVLG